MCARVRQKADVSYYHVGGSRRGQDAGINPARRVVFADPLSPTVDTVCVLGEDPAPNP